MDCTWLVYSRLLISIASITGRFKIAFVTQPEIPADTSTELPLATATISYYVPPSVTPDAVQRQGDVLIVIPGASLPDRCVKCNADADGYRYNKKYTYYPQILLLLFLLNVIIMLIVYVFVKKSMRLEMGLCLRHRAARSRAVRLSAGLLLLGIAMIVGGGVSKSALIIIVGILALLSALIYSNFAVPVLRPKKITKQLGYFRGAGPAFLNSLPGTINA